MNIVTEDEIQSLTLIRAATLIREGHLSPVELTEAVLARIERLNGHMRAFITVTGDEAMRQARHAEQRVTRCARLGPLHGVPVNLKDLYDTAGILTTGGSKVFEDRIPMVDAAAVTLLKQAGAVIVGKTNLHEFAFGTTSVNPHYGAARNPWHPERITGGSSGGSASAVAMSLGFGSLGSDTGGSIRIPAALCGVVGMKPTYGRASVRGLIPLSPSLDHAGPIAQTVEDIAALLQVIAGHDPEDPLTRLDPVPRYAQALTADIRSIRVGVPCSYFFERVAPDIESAVRQAIAVLEQLGAQLVEVDFPSAAKQGDIFQKIAAAEAYAYHRPLLRTSGALYGADVRERLESGRAISMVDCDRAQRAREELRQDCETVFRSVDVIATPAVAVAAPSIGQATIEWPDGPEPVGAALTRLTRPFNLTGMPAISVPCGFTADGMPVGLQIVGRLLDEPTVLRVAYTYQQAAPWVTRRPVAWAAGLAAGT